MKKRISVVQCILTVVFVVTLLLSNIIVNKQIEIPFGLVVSGGFFTFPITYILSDLFSEVYGYKWSRVTCYLAFAMNLLMVAIFTGVIMAPGASYFEYQGCYEIVLGNAPRILVASLSAFVLGDLVNDKLFAKMKAKCNGHEGFAKRAILSSICGQLIDTSVFGLIAFGGQLTLVNIIMINISETVLKMLYEILVVPLTAKLVRVVSKYEEV